MKQFFEHAIPEEVGIRSQNIAQYIKRLDRYNINMHSIIIVRHAKVVLEKYYQPYDAETLHRMFSVTKSFTSLAIGLLEAEGKLSLNDRIVDHFPEKIENEQVHPYIEQMTIRDMLMMATAHSGTTYKQAGNSDWVKSFFVVEPSHKPGTIFAYDTSSSHTLVALVEKLSGLSLLDYLREKFLDEIGFSQAAYALTDPMGITQGGSGLMATPMDLAKVAWIVMHNGQHNGCSYLPAEYIKDATRKQITTAARASGPDLESGYGYQFWRVRNNGFAMFGMGGQLAVCFPDQDLLLVTTADTQGHLCGEFMILDLFYELVLNRLAANKPVQKSSDLQDVVTDYQLRPLAGINNQQLVDKINQREYIFKENPMGLESLRLEFNVDHGKLYYKNKSGSHSIKFGLEKFAISRFPVYSQRCAVSAAWIARHDLMIKCHIIGEELGSIIIQLNFREETLTVFMRKTIGTGFKEFSGFASSY